MYSTLLFFLLSKAAKHKAGVWGGGDNWFKRGCAFHAIHAISFASGQTIFQAFETLQEPVDQGAGMECIMSSGPSKQLTLMFSFMLMLPYELLFYSSCAKMEQKIITERGRYGVPRRWDTISS